MADRVTDSTASIRRGLNQHGCERIVLPSHIRVQSTKLTDISFVAYTDGLCPLCMVYQMAKEFATRRYQLTINNPKEHGYPLECWEDNRTRIESALNVTILSITQGSNNQLFELRVVAGCNLMGRLIPWADTYMDDSDTKIVLGINAAGIPVCIDFGQLPHWLLAAATGMGKTQLVLLILHQLTQKGYVIYLADYKGVDFGSEYRKPGHYADNDADLEQMLDSVVRELNRRRTEFSIAGCANLEEYVRTTGDDLHRIVVILDETSMILDTTGRDKEGKAAISVITNKLLAIGRLGRALGIHLLVATQRPDVGSVPGSLKAQLDGRICGHTADAQSSIVILDDGSAANLPAIPGRFIIRNGSETDDIVQAYYYHK